MSILFILALDFCRWEVLDGGVAVCFLGCLGLVDLGLGLGLLDFFTVGGGVFFDVVAGFLVLVDILVRVFLLFSRIDRSYGMNHKVGTKPPFPFSNKVDHGLRQPMVDFIRKHDMSCFG